MSKNYVYFMKKSPNLFYNSDVINTTDDIFFKPLTSTENIKICQIL